MEKKISYINRNFDDYRSALIELSQKYYPQLATSFDDASVGSWMIDLNAAIADELSYHIDKAFQETNINSANMRSSVFDLARSNGLKIPGPKGSMAEAMFTCQLPLSPRRNGSSLQDPDWSYAPVIKRGTRLAAGAQMFEVVEDIDFGEQFSSDGVSNRLIVPLKNSNNLIYAYRVVKTAVVVAGESRIYRVAVKSADIKPFMEIIIPAEGVMNVESIVVKDGTSYQSNPTMGEFYQLEEEMGQGKPIRFFEVDSLAQQQRWGEVVTDGEAETHVYGYEVSGNTIPTYSVTKGEWKNLKHKFITEFTDNGYLKVIFGAGYNANTDTKTISGASSFAKYQISRMINNDSLGVLPNPNSTIFILYRVGGGAASNVAKGAINTITYLDTEIGDGSTNPVVAASVRSSITVQSTSPSVSGKDAPTVDEVKNLIKYNSGAQERCITVKDYISRVLLMPPKYGVPFRVGAAEANNKIMLYLMGINAEGKLDDILPVALIENIENYLADYRSINDFVEIKSGKIINLQFEADVFIDKNYNKSDVTTRISNAIRDYMNVNDHQMGDDIFVGDLERVINQIDGVISLIELRVYNVFGEGYSPTQTSQEIMVNDPCCNNGEPAQANRLRIDLEASDKIIYSEGDTMLEVKYPEKDIKIRIKEH